MSLVTGNQRPKLFNVADYWPQPQAGQTLVNTFDNGIVQTFRKFAEGYRLRETRNGKWTDDWFYRIHSKRGVLEYADDYPKTTLLQRLMFWTDIVHQPMVPGKEIVWGINRAIVEGQECLDFAIIKHGAGQPRVQ